MDSPPAERRPRSRAIYLLPNLFTTGCLFSGFYAIVAAIDGNFHRAGFAIFLAMLFDTLDGRVARMTRTESAFDRPVLDPPPTDTTQSAPCSRNNASARSVTSTGVCIAAPVNRAVSNGPSSAATLSPPCRAISRTWVAPSRSASARTVAAVPRPKTTRVRTGSKVKLTEVEYSPPGVVGATAEDQAFRL